MDFYETYTPRFQLGEIIIFPGVEWIVEEQQEISVEWFLARHAQGDWGDGAEEGKKNNERALLDGGKINSYYYLSEAGRALLITTDEDRKKTWLYLSEED